MKYSSSIFISYRREDTLPYAGRLSDELARHFPDCKIFMDIDAIGYGVNFGEEIQKAVTSCDVLIALIGRQWLRITDENGQRRLDNPDDWVRLEIGKALKAGIRVIPILLQGAAMPSADALAAEIRGLAGLNALDISDGRWRHDISLLIDTLNGILLERTDLPPTEPVSSDASPKRSQRWIPRRLHIPTPAKTILAIVLASAVLSIMWRAGLVSPGTNVNKAPAGNWNATTQTSPAVTGTPLSASSELASTAPASTPVPSESELPSVTPTATPALQASPVEASTPTVKQIIEGSNIGPRLPRSAIESELSRIGASCSWSVDANNAAVCKFSYAYRKLPTEWSATFKDDKLEKLISNSSFHWGAQQNGNPYSPRESSTGSKGDVDRYCSSVFHDDFISSMVRTFGSPISPPEKTLRDLSSELHRENCEGRPTIRTCSAAATETKEQYIFRVSTGRLLRFTWQHSSGSINLATDRSISNKNWGGCSYNQFLMAE